MRTFRAAILVLAFTACRRPSDMNGIYVSADSAGMFFPCDSADVAFLVPDSGLAVRYRNAVSAPREPLFVRLRGVKRRSGSIYDGRRWFQVQQVLEIRPRASGECPSVAHPLSTVLPSE